MTSETTHPLVIFTPSGRRGHVAAGTTVLEAARHLGVDLDSVCGGRGICSKCQVAVGHGRFDKHGLTVAEDALSPPNAVEDRYDRVRGLKEGRRLGCQAKILGDVVLDVPPSSQLHAQVIRKEASIRQMTMDPATRLVEVSVARPEQENPTGDAHRLIEALEAQGVIAARVALPVLDGLQKCLRVADWHVSCAVFDDGTEAPRVTAVWPAATAPRAMGLAIDLGSTTIAGHLVALDDGEVLASGGLMNPQIRFGEDLMSRVSYAMMNDGGAAQMTSAVRVGLAELAEKLAHDAGVSRTDLLEAVIVCNPVMHHLLLGLDPVELGQAPFTPATSEAIACTTAELGLDLAPDARAFLLPLIAGHVGADAAAVVLAEAPQDAEVLTLIVDVGTNAEIILGQRGKVLACSSPTGPAFEGAQISSGQRAAPGAIERVRIDPETGEPRFRVIGCDLWSDAPGFANAIATTGITGICGSGIIEAVAEMRLAGILDPAGRIGTAEQTGTARSVPAGRVQEYVLHEGENRITVTQNDIRAIQLAKSALAAGAQLLLDEVGAEAPEKIILAGAFGAHISPLHALVLGMIPDCKPENVSSTGNAAGTGARIALCSRVARRDISNVVAKIEHIETALAEGFQDHFVAANAIPNAVQPYRRLAEVVTLPDVSYGAAGARKRRRR